MTNINDIINICSLNLIKYLEKYGIDKNNSKINISIIKNVIAILTSEKDRFYLTNNDLISLYNVILIIKNIDSIIFKGIDLIDVNDISDKEFYDFIYNFKYS